MAAVDNRGRVADQMITKVLGWTTGCHLLVEVAAGLVLIRPSSHGRGSLTFHRHLHLPTGVRRACGIEAGDRVLLAAEPDGLLVIYPPTALDTTLPPPVGHVAGGDLT